MADQGLNPTQNQQVIALIAEATARPLEVVDGRTQTLQADMNAMRSTTEELMQKTHGVLKEMQQQAIDFRAEVVNAQATASGQVGEMRQQVAELNTLGARLREIATRNDADVAAARRDIDQVKAEALSSMAGELAKLKEQAELNTASLNRLYYETRQGLQEIEMRVQRAAGTGEARSTSAGVARGMPSSPQRAREEPGVPVPPSWIGGGAGNAGGSGFGATGGQPEQGFSSTGGWNLHPCFHRKDIEVPTMSEVMSREQFLLWRDKVTDFLEATGSAGITPLLEALHTRRSECSVMDAVGIANGRGVGGGNTTDGEIKRASEAMYAIIRAKPLMSATGTAFNVSTIVC